MTVIFTLPLNSGDTSFIMNVTLSSTVIFNAVTSAVKLALITLNLVELMFEEYESSPL